MTSAAHAPLPDPRLATTGLRVSGVIGVAQRSGILAGGLRPGAFAAVYAGYPLWAFRLARALDVGLDALPESASA
jgi:hypothetical protein